MVISFVNLQVERKKLRKEVSEADFVALISDGTTDTSVVEEEIVYISYAVRGSVQVKFLAIVPTPKADAAGIV